MQNPGNTINEWGHHGQTWPTLMTTAAASTCTGTGACARRTSSNTPIKHQRLENGGKHNEDENVSDWIVND